MINEAENENVKNDNKKVEARSNIIIPPEFDYSKISGLNEKSRKKLEQECPKSLGQAAEIDGLTQADIDCLQNHFDNIIYEFAINQQLLYMIVCFGIICFFQNQKEKEWGGR